MTDNPDTNTATQSKIELIIFDLDGTLVDTRRDLANAVNYARREMGRTELPLADIMAMVGNGMKMLLKRALGTADAAQIDSGITLFRNYYSQNLAVHSSLYPGVDTFLRQNAHQKLSVISNKPEEFTIPLLEQLGVASHFDLIMGGDSAPELKPSPVPISIVLNKLNVNRERAIIVGDGSPDIQAGKNAGILTCAVTYGFRRREELLLEGPDFIIDNITQLGQYIGFL